MVNFFFHSQEIPTILRFFCFFFFQRPRAFKIFLLSLYFSSFSLSIFTYSQTQNFLCPTADFFALERNGEKAVFEIYPESEILTLYKECTKLVPN